MFKFTSWVCAFLFVTMAVTTAQAYDFRYVSLYRDEGIRVGYLPTPLQFDEIVNGDTATIAYIYGYDTSYTGYSGARIVCIDPATDSVYASSWRYTGTSFVGSYVLYVSFPAECRTSHSVIIETFVTAYDWPLSATIIAP